MSVQPKKRSVGTQAGTKKENNINAETGGTHYADDFKMVRK